MATRSSYSSLLDRRKFTGLALAGAVSAASAASAASGRTPLVQVVIRSEAPLKGGRAMLVIRKVQTLGTVNRVQPSLAAFESDDFDGRFAFELDSAKSATDIEAVIRSVGDVERVSFGGAAGDEGQVSPGESAGRGRHGGATCIRSRAAPAEERALRRFATIGGFAAAAPPLSPLGAPAPRGNIGV